MSRFKNIIFDLDGTLTDSKEGITKSIQFALGEMGVLSPSTEALHWCIGPPLALTFARIFGNADEALIKSAISHYRVRFAEVGMFENSVYPGVREMLETIRASNTRTFVATSKPEVYAIRILDHFNLSTFFEVIHGSGLDGTRSDKAELIAYVLATENLDSETTVMIGDREHDILGGKRNKIRTAAVTYGYGTPEEIAATQPDMIFNSPLEILALLKFT